MKTFKCAMCKKRFPFIESENEEAIKELKTTFGSIPVDECEIVCDDCYKKVMEELGLVK